MILKQIEHAIECFSCKKKEEELVNYFAKIKQGVQLTKEILGEPYLLQTDKGLKETVNQLDQQLVFLSKIKINPFIQIPLQGNLKQTELMVFKDGKSKKNNQELVTAFIGLDTLNMDRFEVFVQKKEQNIICGFRVNDKRVERLVRSHIGVLNELLAEKMMMLSSYTIRIEDKPFHLLDKLDKDKPEKMLSFDAKA